MDYLGPPFRTMYDVAEGWKGCQTTSCRFSKPELLDTGWTHALIENTGWPRHREVDIRSDLVDLDRYKRSAVFSMPPFNAHLLHIHA
jgi:hypothetical protein